MILNDLFTVDNMGSGSYFRLSYLFLFFFLILVMAWLKSNETCFSEEQLKDLSIEMEDFTVSTNFIKDGFLFLTFVYCFFFDLLIFGKACPPSSLVSQKIH